MTAKENTNNVSYWLIYYSGLGLSYTAIAQRLNMLGYRNEYGRIYNRNSIMLMFKRI